MHFLKLFSIVELASLRTIRLVHPSILSLSLENIDFLSFPFCSQLNRQKKACEHFGGSLRARFQAYIVCVRACVCLYTICILINRYIVCYFEHSII